MEKLYKQVKEVIKNSYSPYSNFRVAAALELKNGETITGVNIENAGYSLSICAERSALFTAYSQGIRKEDIKKIMIYTDKDHFVSPCGACRQVMNELMEPEADVIFATANGKFKELKNKDLLPYGFTKEDM